jgi:hypothetical protein
MVIEINSNNPNYVFINALIFQTIFILVMQRSFLCISRKMETREPDAHFHY